MNEEEESKILSSWEIQSSFKFMMKWEGSVEIKEWFV